MVTLTLRFNRDFPPLLGGPTSTWATSLQPVRAAQGTNRSCPRKPTSVNPFSYILSGRGSSRLSHVAAISTAATMSQIKDTDAQIEGY